MPKTTKRGPRNPKMLTAGGVTLPISGWAKRLGCSVQTVYARLYRGVNPTLAATLPVIESGSNLCTHGMSHLAEWGVWHSMIVRCQDSFNQDYGGRGIKVCARWAASFVNFLQDMGPRPDGDFSIDRINVNGNYRPGNCRWATRVTQQRNRRDTRILNYGGDSRPLLEWAEAFSIPPETIQRRLDRGWSIEKSLRTPIAVKHRRKQ